MDNAPCFLCGYNGEGYYQPDKHPCIERYRLIVENSQQPQRYNYCLSGFSCKLLKNNKISFLDIKNLYRRIYVEIKENFLQYTPVLYLELIKELVEKRKYRSRTDFVNEAIKNQLAKEGVSVDPKENLELKDWWDEDSWENKA